jgi:c-di-GMP-binding flagellar brake protein YcgR
MAQEKPGQSSSVLAPERRSLPRYPVDEDTVLLLTSHGVPMPGRIEDLSLSGCRVRARDRISATAGSRIEISFKVNGVSFRFNGIVAWTHGANMAGIRFVNMIPRRKAELAEIVGEMEAEQAARAEAVNPEVESQGTLSNQEALSPPLLQASQPAPEQSTQPENAGVKSATPLAPTNAGPDETNSAPAPRPADRRGSVRHAVDTSAIVLLINIGSTLRGRIVDLSQSGCRIRTQERFPVGIFTRVETEFHLQGLPFRLGGVVQAIHDRNTVGIRFLDLSDRRRQQMADLIREIQQIQTAEPEAAPTEGQTAANES